MTRYVRMFVCGLLLGTPWMSQALPMEMFLYSGGSFQLLGVPAGSTATQPFDLNDAGQIVGYYVTGTGRRAVTHSFLYSGGSFQTLVPPDSRHDSATAINNKGQIVGQFTDPSGQDHAYLYSEGTFQILDPAGGTFTAAQGINNGGQVVGSFYDGTRNHGFIYRDGEFHILDPPNSHHSFAFAINDPGEVAGYFIDSTGDHQGFLYSGGSFQVFDPPDPNTVVSRAMNNAGQIVGTFVLGCLTFPCPDPEPSHDSHGFLYRAGSVAVFDPPSSVNSIPSDINNAGHIVGGMFDALGTSHGFLYSRGTFLTLDFPCDLPHCRTTTSVFAINNAGQIVGVGAGATDVPEPPAWLLLSASLLSLIVYRARSGSRER